MQQLSKRSPLLSLPGAVPAEGVDEGVAAHYGDLFREQRALADGTGFVDLSHRGVVTVNGEDRLSWLHLLLTQHVSELPAGQATEALILSAHGHIEHALYLVDDGETVWAHVEPGTREALIAYLESMKFFYRVEVADRTDEFAVVHLPAGSIAEVPEGVVVRETAHGRDLFLPREELVSYAERSGPARRGPPSAARIRDRPPHHPARTGLDRHRSPPPEGLLPGSGDRRPGAESRQAAAPARLPASGRQ
jgi:tRNA-modifying protein YgfZ